MSIIIIKERVFKVSTLLSDTTEFIPHGDSMCLRLINRTVSVKAEYQGLSADGSGLGNRMILFLQPNVPLFQHSIIPWQWHRPGAIKSPLISFNCRISETYIISQAYRRSQRTPIQRKNNPHNLTAAFQKLEIDEPGAHRTPILPD